MEIKTHLKITATLGLWMLIAGSIAGYAQDRDATREIRNTIRQYYHAMAVRDVDALQGVLDKSFRS